MLRWAESPRASTSSSASREMNLFLLLGQLGLSWDLSDQPLLPIGTVYDPFVLRGLDAFLYGDVLGCAVRRRRHAVRRHARARGRRAPVDDHGVGRAGAARRDVHRAGVRRRAGLAAVRRARRAIGRAATTTRRLLLPAVDPRRSTRPRSRRRATRLGDAVLRRQVLAGAYRLVDASRHPELRRAHAPVVHLAASGAVLPEVRRRRRGARRRGDRRARRGHHLARPALPRVAADAATGRADGDRAERRRCAAHGVPRPRARRDRARRRVARDGLARVGARRARACRSASTSSASPAPSASSTSCTTCCREASSTPPLRRYRVG